MTAHDVQLKVDRAAALWEKVAEVQEDQL